MALLEALAVEPFRDLNEIWIGLRGDGNKGSGRADDPVHGGVLLTPPLMVSLSINAGSTEITATTNGAHGYLEGDLILLSDTRSSAGVPTPAYDGPGQVSVTGLPPNQFKCYLDVAATSTFQGSAT